jgi:hypothetical protein
LKESFVKEGAFMSRSPSRRVVAAVLVVMVCLLAAPVKSHAAGTWDSIDNPAGRLWKTAMAWFRDLWTGPAMTGHLPNDGKFGAGHSSDGLAKAKARAEGAY